MIISISVFLLFSFWNFLSPDANPKYAEPMAIHTSHSKHCSALDTGWTKVSFPKSVFFPLSLNNSTREWFCVKFCKERKRKAWSIVDLTFLIFLFRREMLIFIYEYKFVLGFPDLNYLHSGACVWALPYRLELVVAGFWTVIIFNVTQINQLIKAANLYAENEFPSYFFCC